MNRDTANARANALFDTWIALARAVPIEQEIDRRGTKLRGTVERVGPCPKCDGTDRFSINMRKRCWNCRGCQVGGDIIKLVEHLDGVDFIGACTTLIGAPMSKGNHSVKRLVAVNCRQGGNDGAKPACGSDRGRQLAGEIWHSARPISGTLAETYLRRRGLGLRERPNRVLRFYPDCPFGMNARKPCMIALFRNIATDEPQAIHRTALTAEGSKIDRKYLRSPAGAAIKLSASIGQELTIGEGIETTLAGMQLGFAPGWALGDAGNLQSFPVIPNVTQLTILVDYDRAGEDAARTCMFRWFDAGRKVRRVKSTNPDEDMNDVLLAGHGA